jgi:signal transduction histidine kinase
MTHSVANISVLVIDDEPFVRESITSYLEDSGFLTIQAENGQEGIAIFRSEKPDVVLIDLRMPGLDGLDVLDILAEESPETPLIVISGAGIMQDAIHALQSGAWDYIMKPIQELAMLEHSVRKGYERSRLLIENREYREHLEAEIKKRTAELEDRTFALERANKRLQEEITEHRRTEAQLRHSQKMEAIGTLAGGIAHDFNNILFPIVGYTQMTMDDVSQDSIAWQNLQNILKAARRAGNLVNQILAFCRGEEHDPKPLTLHLIVQEALILLGSTLPATIEIRKNISKICRPVSADPTQIHQMVMNLCANAYHAMRGTGGVLEVILDEASPDPDVYPEIPPGSYIRLTVSDTGHGIPKSHITRIFDPYFTTKPVGEGSGLGLSMVHGIVRSHNGHISVHSEAGKGTRFDIWLPMIADDIAESSEIGYREEDSLPLPGGDESILLVDNEAQIIDMEKQMLERLGYRVTVADSGRKASEYFRQQPKHFDLVITDMTMPDMTGLKLSAELLRIRPDVPIILCTGFNETLTEEMIKAIGIRELVMKPAFRNEIAATIRRVLGKDK